MPAFFGAPDLSLWASPLPELLRRVSGLEQEPSGNHVRLDESLGTRSVQRLALSDVGGKAVAGLWPGELKAQALYLYTDGRAHAMFGAARERRWEIIPRPALAFFNSHPSQRLYMLPQVTPQTYADRWERVDADKIGRFDRRELPTLRAWLEQRGYLTDGDMPAVERFEAALGQREIDVRPGLMLIGTYSQGDVHTLDLAAEIRDDVNAILRAAGEPLIGEHRARSSLA